MDPTEKKNTRRRLRWRLDPSIAYPNLVTQCATARRSGDGYFSSAGNLHGGGGPAAKRRSRRRGGLGGETRGGRRWENEEMKRFAGEMGYKYPRVKRNRRSDRRAPSDCLFGFNGVDVAVRERSSSSEKDGGSTAEDLL